MALTKRKLVKWLLSHEFSEQPGKKSSHRKYIHGPTGVAVTIAMHGRPELSSKHQGMILRQLEKAGFDRDPVKNEWS